MIFYVVILKKRLKTTTLEAIKRTDNSRFALRKKGTFEQLTLLIARLKLFRTYKLLSLSKPFVECDGSNCLAPLRVAPFPDPKHLGVNRK